uniref:Germacrene A hydroxylase n=1 Tax=Barnadesia spinosa TaxID=171760 RepID=GAO_BARSP|nr:RecName: Full=Germacrene A hydroxylase; AltName: Full=Germacrene A oxidase; Short=BsGAO [Barnadesia spinosa]ADF43083.1 germacrene A oxidase [Barnadesia spinosa]
MELTLTTSLGLAVFVFILFKLLTGSKSTKNSLPEAWRLPIIGHMHHLVGTLPHRGVTDMARKYGSLMHLQLGEVSTIVVSSPRWAKEVLTTYDITFANRPETLTGEIVAYHNTDIVLSPYGEYWRQLRKLCTLELLSAKKVKSFQSLREEECWNLVKEVRSSGSGSPVDLSESIFKLIATILSRAAFGKGIKDQREFTEIVKEILRLTGGFDVADIFPSKKILHHLSGKRAKLTNIHNKLDSLINNIVSEHPGSRTSSSQESLLDVLLRLKDSAELPLTSDNVKAVILDMFGAGTDTSSATIEWAISELIRCPRAMEKVQTELRQALNGKERIQEEDIQELSYLKLVIKETLRLHPPLPLVMPRECREPCVLAGYEIPTKTKLIVNVFAINRDPEYWKDAETFMPERFENSPINIMGSEYEYLPFGAGRRMCPGAALGLANVELPLAHILYYFNWKLPNGARLDELDMSECFGATVQRKSELLLVPTAYKTANNSA